MEALCCVRAQGAGGAQFVRGLDSAQARVYATGQGREADATDALSVTLVCTRLSGRVPVINDKKRGRPIPGRRPTLSL